MMPTAINMIIVLWLLCVCFSASSNQFVYSQQGNQTSQQGNPVIDWFNDMSGILTFSGVIIAVGFFIIEQRVQRGRFENEQRLERMRVEYEFKERLRRALLTLKTDVQGIRQIFFSDIYEKQKEESIDITYAQISTDVYDSLVSSGLFSYLQEDTQTALGNFYFNIKLHNRALTEKTRYKLEFELGYTSIKRWEYQEVNKNYGIFVTGYDSEIKERIPEVEKCLDEELKKLSKTASD